MKKVTDFSVFKAKKRAKVIEEDLKQILKIVNLSYTSLKFFQKYKPVNDLLFDLLSYKVILQAHLRKCQEMIKKNEN